MVQSRFSHWRQAPIIVILSSFSLISIVSIIVILNQPTSSSPTSEKYDINLLSSLCNQHNTNKEKQPPQWVTGHQHTSSNDRIKKESEQINHMYGKDNEFISSAKGQTTINKDIWNGLPVKGAFYMLVQENDLADAKATIRNIEDTFTSMPNTSYPFIILSSQLIKPDFKKYVRKATKSPNRIFFGQIDLEAWSYPYWIDSVRSENAMQRLRQLGVEDAPSTYFNKAQRYNAGLFFHHPLFDDVEYVWRLEPGTTYTCNMFHNDPFKRLQKNNKKLGFVLTNMENEYNVQSLYLASAHFISRNKAWVLSEDKTIFPWLTDENDKYNRCQISSSFQIVDMAFLKSEAYQIFFHYLDLVGGFFYERWTDASVRTIAASMFLHRGEITYLDSLGFESELGEQCPFNDKDLQACTCEFAKNHAFYTDSCTLELLRYVAPKKLRKMMLYFDSKLPLSVKGEEEQQDVQQEDEHDNEEEN